MVSRVHSLLAYVGLIAVLTFLPLLAPTSAQTQRGQIVGRITDSTGAVVPAASVEVTDPATGVKLETKTNDSGFYTVPYVQYGRYEVKVTAAGFAPYLFSGVEVATASTTTVNVELKLSSITTEVTVQEATPVVLESMSSGVGAVVEEKLKSELPNIVSGQKRNATSYVYTAPGVNPAGAGLFGPTEQMTIGGGRTLSQVIMIDGQTTSTASFGTSHGGVTCLTGCTGGDLPSVESIGEFKLLLNSMPAEYGRSSGGTMIFSSKSGTNDYHGAAYEYLRNHKLDARPWEAPVRNVLKQNEFGVAGGGPLVIPKLYNGKSKTFFWSSLTGYTRRSDPSTGIVTLPTEAMRRGDFSAVDLNPIYDVLDRFTDSGGTTQRRQFSSGGRLNVIDPARLSRVSNYFFNRLPLPTRPGSVNNFVGSSRQTLDTRDVSGKLDHYLGNKSRISGYYEWGKQTLDEGSILGEFFGRTIYNDRHRLRLDWSFNIRPNLIHQAIYGFTRPTNSSAQNGFGENIGRAAGITGTPDGNCPLVWIVNPVFGFCLGSPNDSAANLISTFNDSLVWNKGKHNFKTGLEFIRWNENSNSTARSAGSYLFDPGQTANINNTGGNVWASFALGYPAPGQVSTASPLTLGVRQSYLALFMQDDWKATQKLTISAGLRWDLNLPFTEVHDQITNLDLTMPNPGANNLPGALTYFGDGPGRNGLSRLGAIHWKNFAPRLGLAYQIDSKTVFRGFAGLVHQGITSANALFADRTGFQASGSPLPPVDPLGLYYSWDTPFPQAVLGTVPFTNPAFRNGQSVDYNNPQGVGRAPELYMWSAGFQRELPFNILIEATYLANNVKHSSDILQLNQLAPQYRDLGPLLLRPLNSPEVQAAGFRAPFPQFDTNLALFRALLPYPQFSGVRGVAEPYTASTYHAALFKAQKRFSSGLSFLVSYTVSKYITDSGWGPGAFGETARDTYNRKLDKGIQPFDIPQRLVLSYSYDAPFGRGKKFGSNASKPAQVLFGGWTISGIHQYRSGTPVSLQGTLSQPIPTVRSHANRVAGVPVRSSISCGEMEFGNPLKNYIWNAGNPLQAARTGRPLAFAPPGDFKVGNMPKVDPEARNCAVHNEDVSLTKSISITEKVRARFGADVFNVLNRHTWQADPQRNSITASNFGEIRPFQASGPRQVQMKFRIEW